MAELLEAERITPEQIRSHRVVRQLASDLLSMQDPASSELWELAERIGGGIVQRIGEAAFELGVWGAAPPNVTA
jgi:hypothetical protein